MMNKLAYKMNNDANVSVRRKRKKLLDLDNKLFFDDDFDDCGDERYETTSLASQFAPADLMLWYNDDKRDHVEKDYASSSESLCDTAEVLLQRGLNVKTLTPEEEYDLFSQYKSETNAYKKAVLRDEFLTRNLRLVMHLAKQIAQQRGYEPKELISWGVMGMIRAFEKFSLTKGAKFSTYAAQWIKQAITRGLADTQRAIRVPYNVVTDQGKMKKFEQKFLTRTGVEATDEDICAYFGWSKEKLEHIRKGLDPITSIDIPATDEEENTIADLLVDEGPSIEDEVCADIRHESVMKVLADTLDDRAKDIILNIFEFNGNASLDKFELADKYDITPERVLQIRDEAIALLRHPSKSRNLRGFLR